MISMMLHLHLMTCYQEEKKYKECGEIVTFVQGLNNFNDVAFAFDDVL